MTCAEARAWLDAYMDGELELERAVAIERHLAECPDCAKALASRRALGRVLRDTLDYAPAPASLQRAARAAGTATRPGWMRLAASFLLIAGLSSGLTYYATLRPPESAAIADEVFASHMRAAEADNRLIDIASSDEHTVKPWLDARLDFAPPVKDLSASGYALIGGRIDYIGGHRAAVLVYRLRLHLITLFIWPSSESRRPVATSTARGESLAHWSDGSMAYWAISDVPAADLLAFYRDFAAAGPLAEPPPAGH
jgi:anti-sigma factor RsiW